MLNVTDYGIRLLLELAVAADKLCFGSLMSPAHAAREVQGRGMRAPANGWWLCGTLHPAMFGVAQCTPLRHLGKAIVTDAGTTYLVLAQQAPGWQHRFVLQLVGEQMLDYVQAVRRGACELSLGHAHRDESLLVTGCDYLQPLLANGVHVARVPEDLVSLARETCHVAAAMLNPSAIADDALEPVQRVCVSLVASKDVLQNTVRVMATIGHRAAA
jgi:hypothetical protein